MIFIFQVRYSGWPCDGKWVACVEDESIRWVEPYLEELIDDVKGSGDQAAADASDEIRRRCFLAGGDTPNEALSRLLANHEAANSIHGYG